MHDVSNIRAAVAGYFREKAAWRCRMSDMHPYDARNARAADALIAMAEFVAALPLDNEALVRLANAKSAFNVDGDVYWPPDAEY